MANMTRRFNNSNLKVRNYRLSEATHLSILHTSGLPNSDPDRNFYLLIGVLKFQYLKFFPEKLFTHFSLPVCVSDPSLQVPEVYYVTKHVYGHNI
jgi:hypothetical protein